MDDNRTALCPLVDEHIDGFDCMEFQVVREESIPDKFKQKPQWRSICESCKYRKCA